MLNRIRGEVGAGLIVGTVALVASLGFIGLLGSPVPPAAAAACPNEAVRIGLSANLPDCRAYELVTPPDTNGLMPFGGIGVHTSKFDGAAANAGLAIDTPSVSADGESFLWLIVGTTIPGTDGGGINNQYRADRSATGWSSRLQGPDSTEAQVGVGGGATADFEYQAFTVQGTGLLLPIPNSSMTWMRQPDDSFRPVGEGTLPAEPDTDGYENGFADDLFDQLAYITPTGDHQIFYGNHGEVFGQPIVPLTSNAPAEGISAVYDRTPDGLHLASILPDGTTPTNDSIYSGASPDGSVIAFLVSDGFNATLYARIDNQTTQEIVSGAFSGIKFAGASNQRVFYWQGGNLYVYDLDSEETTAITSSGDATYVRVSKDGSRVFFLSETQLDGPKGVAGQPNLYVWDGSDIAFIGTTLTADTNATVTTSEQFRGGIDYWVTRDGFPWSPAAHWRGNQNTTRATANGSVFVFTSDANLTGQNPGNHFQVYRYLAESADLACVSCPTDGSNTTGDSFLTDGGVEAGTATEIPNLTEDGGTVFFETLQDLVPRDSDGRFSVYEWRAGSLAMLSSGATARGDHIVGATPDGSQVFISTTDRLVPDAQVGGVSAIYDVRMNGGFPPLPEKPDCSGASCPAQTGNGSPGSPSLGSLGLIGRSSAVHGKFRVLRRVARGRRSGAVRLGLTVSTPGAGTIAAHGERILDARKLVPRGAVYRLGLHLTREAKRQLQLRGTLRIPVQVIFTPRRDSRGAGRVLSRRVTLTVHQPRRDGRSQAGATRGAHR
jgi:hypothetical protein